jgi:acyl-CoA synthetase (AMP-forming)/AMP-acid ligase II
MLNERNNLPSVLAARAALDDKVAFHFLRDGMDDVVAWTYRDVERMAARVAAELRLRELAGKRVLLTLEPGLLYIAALFGILKAGAVAVPSFPPAGKRAQARLASIFNDCLPELIIADSRAASIAGRVTASLNVAEKAPQWLFMDESFFSGTHAAAIGESALQADADLFCADRPALLQYTSGSTGTPKGVIITHGNLVANCLAIERHLGPQEQRIGCSWLPPYHDMGLMGAIILSVYNGFTLVILSPAHFVQSPYRWLQAISRYRVTTSVAPNFALDLCVNSISDEELAALDLSCLRQVFCGAEPVLQASLDKFCERFAPCGFSPAAFVPCYGMAEATLFVSGKSGDMPPKAAFIDKELLARGVVHQVMPDNKRGTHVVSCGTIAAAHQVEIVDPETSTVLPPGTIGEIWVRGANVANGYWNRPGETARTFGGRLAGAASKESFLRTGDLGFMMDGELFIAGRIKDVVIIAGRNLYPQDIELSVTRCHESIRANGAVAFSVSDGQRAEQLVVVAELSRRFMFSATALDEVRRNVEVAVSADHGVTPSAVHLAPAGGIPLTTSGKVRRLACKQAYLQGALPTVQATGITRESRRDRSSDTGETHV